MLRLNLDPTFSDNVEITVPGQQKSGTIPLVFKYRDRDQLKEWLESVKGLTITEAFQQFVKGWGLNEEFSPENIETFLRNYPVAYGEILDQYMKMLVVSRIKN